MHTYAKGSVYKDTQSSVQHNSKKKKKKTRKKIKCGRQVQETHVYLQLTNADVWQKPTQYCKAIILQLRKGKEKKKRKIVEKIFT